MLISDIEIKNCPFLPPTVICKDGIERELLGVITSSNNTALVDIFDELKDRISLLVGKEIKKV